MKAVQQESPRVYWARVRNGRFSIWDGRQEVDFKHLNGRICGIYFKNDEYNGTSYEIALFHLIFEDERWIMSVRVDSQYFRTLCNYLHSVQAAGKLHETLTFSPMLDEKEGRKFSALYVSQGQKYFRAHFTQTSGRSADQPIVHEVGGRKIYDWTPVNDFYKAFLTSNFSAGWDGVKHETEPAPASLDIPPPPEDPDDLPF